MKQTKPPILVGEVCWSVVRVSEVQEMPSLQKADITGLPLALNSEVQSLKGL